jgi:hypothetical protein
MLLARFGVSERRACRTLGLNRSTQRLTPPVIAEETELRAWLRKFSTDRPALGEAASGEDGPPGRVRRTTNASAGCGATKACAHLTQVRSLSPAGEPGVENSLASRTRRPA